MAYASTSMQRVARVSLLRTASPPVRLTGRSCRTVSTAVEDSNLPRVASPSIWQSIIPKAFRRPDDPVSVAERRKAQAQKSKDWNPATFFIVISLLIGSNAIQMIALRNERRNFNLKIDAKIALLKETLERVRRGEDVDVAKALGTGVPEQEKEWEEVMKEVETADTFSRSQRRKEKQAAEKVSRGTAVGPEPQEHAAVTSSEQTTTVESTKSERPGFY